MGLTIGVDVGGTKVLAGVVDESGQILETARQSTPQTHPEAIADVIAGLVSNLRLRHEVEAVGIGAAGWIDLDRANVLFAPNLVWRNEPISKRVQKLIDLPIIVENDANCHVWAESRFGAARGYRSVAAVILGTGIGGGMALDGTLYRGGFGIAAEFGHFRAVPDGRLCGCGNRGCWEQYASGMALVREAREMARLAPISVPYLLKAVAGEVDAITGPLVTEAANAGDEGARQCFDTVGRWVGQGLADLATILDPSCFVVGGGPSDAGPLLMDPAREAFAAALSGGAYRPHAPVLQAQLGSSAGLVGAADLARIR
ncbi:MAG: glucokinase [Actinomycetota bacterium]|jgi:glucokinase|nr:glucokinase [Actinomycetota bacterium]MDQ1541949.1 glucokinase [Actinomycetota bacterium]